MGAQPGDCVDSNTFTLPQHENNNFTEEESAERIAEYFAHISQLWVPKKACFILLKLPTTMIDSSANLQSPKNI